MSPTHRTILVLIFIAACAHQAAAQTHTKSEEAVLAADAAWLNAYDSKDIEKSLSFCDEQASMLVQNAPSATGKKTSQKPSPQNSRSQMTNCYGVR